MRGFRYRRNGKGDLGRKGREEEGKMGREGGRGDGERVEERVGGEKRGRSVYPRIFRIV